MRGRGATSCAAAERIGTKPASSNDRAPRAVRWWELARGRAFVCTCAPFCSSSQLSVSALSGAHEGSSGTSAAYGSAPQPASPWRLSPHAKSVRHPLAAHSAVRGPGEDSSRRAAARHARAHAAARGARWSRQARRWGEGMGTCGGEPREAPRRVRAPPSEVRRPRQTPSIGAPLRFFFDPFRTKFRRAGGAEARAWSKMRRFVAHEAHVYEHSGQHILLRSNMVTLMSDRHPAGLNDAPVWRMQLASTHPSGFGSPRWHCRSATVSKSCDCKQSRP